MQSPPLSIKIKESLSNSFVQSQDSPRKTLQYQDELVAGHMAVNLVTNVQVALDRQTDRQTDKLYLRTFAPKNVPRRDFFKTLTAGRK